jgi:GH43 family beta-xylosidase
MKNPWTLETDRVMISTPEYSWQTVGDLDGPVGHVDVNEGPQALIHEGRLFIVYSASGCWTDAYCLGLLSAKPGEGLLDPETWVKAKEPVFESLPEAPAYGTGHNSFFKSPDGTEDWILYHANPEPDQGCGRHRSPRAQRFTWNADGTPNFGKPVKLGKELPAPSGE